MFPSLHQIVSGDGQEREQDAAFSIGGGGGFRIGGAPLAIRGGGAAPRVDGHHLFFLLVGLDFESVAAYHASASPARSLRVLALVIVGQGMIEIGRVYVSAM